MSIARILLGVALAGSATCAGAQSASPPPDRFRPEMLVAFPTGTVVCNSLEALDKFAGHAARGERTKMLAMSIANGGPCAALETTPSDRLRILSVHPLRSTTMMALEIVPADSGMTDGVWTVSGKAVRAKK